MKNVLLLGATGKTGVEVLNYALSKGYRVAALVRDPGKVKIKSDRLNLIKGTPLNINDLRSIDGYDAVISTLGHGPTPEPTGAAGRSSPDLMTESINNLVTVMREKGIRRIIIQTGAGAGDSFGKMPLSIQNIIKETDLSIVYNDHYGQEQILRKSGLDWTVVRPVTLTDRKVNNIFIVEDKVSESYSISRKSVAKFLVDNLETDEFIGRAVVISEPKTLTT